MIFLVAGLFFSLLLYCFFNGCEIGLISSQKLRITHFTMLGQKRAAIIQFFLSRPHLMLSTTLTGTNIALVCASIITEKILAGYGLHDEFILLAATTLILTPLLMVTEVVAKDWFRQAPEERCIIFARLFYASYWIMAIPVNALAGFSAWFINNFSKRKNHKDDARVLLREDFRILLRDSEAAGAIDHEAADLLDRALDFHKQRVIDIMIPLKAVKTLSPETLVKDAVELCRKLDLSRIPINSSSEPDQWQVNSIFSIYDAIFKLDESKWGTTRVMDCCRIPAVIAPDAVTREVLTRAQSVKCQIVMVINRNGKPIGIVTPADVAKQLFD
jgi:CBS domain containing-hemolysin-like protein